MDLTNYTPTAISEIKGRFDEAKYDPTMLIKVALETIEEITNGDVVLVDPTNPAVMLMEMAAVQTANGVQENIALLRKQYSVLAMDDEDLYLHMSDEDYLNRFATPVPPVKFTFAILLEDFVREAVYDSSERSNKLIIPRDTTITVDGVVFATLYPIVLRRYENGVIQISYDPEITNPIYTLKNTIIEPTIRAGSSQENWLFFSVDALQVKDQTTYFTIDKTYNFRKEIVLTDNFYHARVFYKNNATSNLWVEIKTTHSDQVFDITKPTAVLKVLENQLIVEIPVVYTSSNQLTGELRVDVYTTKGSISMNLANYRQDTFVVEMKAIDANRDINVFTLGMGNLSYYVYSLETIVGGSNPLTFEELRNRVIFNSIGPQQLPITNVQLIAEANNNGFDIVREIDVLTNRIFLATRKLPTPAQKKLVTPANIGIVSYTTDMRDLVDHKKAIFNGSRVTIRSKALWKNSNGKLSILSQLDLDTLTAIGQTAMVSDINQNQYFYTPFYYLLDASGDEFEIRSYALDQPYGKDQNFIRQNHTLQLFVNTGSYSMKKTDKGFSFWITTYSAAFYKGLEDAQVGVQMAFQPDGEVIYAYINGVLESKNASNERVYRFDIETNHDIDDKHLLCVTNATIQGITSARTWINLEKDFEFLHWTTSLTEQYRPDDTDYMLGKFMLPAGAAGNSHERITIHFGDTLSNLWRRSRSYLKEPVYQKYDVNIPLYYETDQYERDSVTGSIITIVNGQVTYNVKHKAGDPVLDTSGNQVYKYQIGDLVLDEQNNPIPIISNSTGREMDFLVVDARYLFADDSATVAYVGEIDSTLTAWITENVAFLQNRLLDQTSIFFYPKTTLGVIQVYTENNGQDYLNAEQSFTVDLYVKYSVYSDETIRETLKRATVEILDKNISLPVINMTDIRDQLNTVYGDSVSAFMVKGLGGDRDYQVIRVASEKNKLCLKKNLIIQSDRTMFVEDAVEVSFKIID